MTQATVDRGLAQRIPDALSESTYFDSHPTVMFEIDDFLSDSTFNELASSFPNAHTNYRTHVNGEKKYLENSKQAFWDVLATTPEWRQFYDDFCSGEVIDRLQAFAGPHITHRPAHERQPWRLKQPLRRRPGLVGTIARIIHRRWSKSRPRRWWRILIARCPSIFHMPTRTYTAVELGFEFSILTDGDSIPPHTDQVDKLLSLMLYFPDSDQQSNGPLGTEFWRGRDGRAPWVSWKSQQLNDADSQRFYADHEMYYQAPFRPKRLVGFIKSDISWHGLRPLQLNPGMERRALVINIFYREPSARPRLMRRRKRTPMASLTAAT